MTTLKYIREIKDTSLLLLGIVGEGEFADYTVNSTLYAEIGSPSVGDTIDSSSLSAIKYADELYRAKKKALSILAYSDNNQKNLKAKLLRAGFSHEISDRVCEKMVSYGYINEKNQLERLILIEQRVRNSLMFRHLLQLMRLALQAVQAFLITRQCLRHGSRNF